MRKLAVLLLSAAVLTPFTYAAIVLAGDILGFTEQVSPPAQLNATEPYIAVDRSDGTVYVAWQASGAHAARSDDGGRTFVQLPLANAPFGSDLGDVAIRVGGATPCMTVMPTCLPGAHRVYITALERLPLLLQTHLFWSDDRGANWGVNNIAAVNPSLIDRPWLAVFPSKHDATEDQVYISYHDFSVSQINVAASNDGGQSFGPSIDVLGTNLIAFANSFCNTVPSDIEVDPQTGEVYVQWITADPVANIGQGCNITQIQNFHQVWVAHSLPAMGTGTATVTAWDAHKVFDGGPGTNTDEIFATLAVDDSGIPGTHGNVYSVFPDNLSGPQIFDIWFTHSGDKGVSWSERVKVNNDKGTHYFPWIAAGSTGRVDFIWLNSPDFTPTDAEQSPWFVTFAQTTNGNTATPKFQQTAASSSVMHVGGICTNGLFCDLVSGGNRDLADSISIAIDRGGSAALVWTEQGRVLNGPTHITYACVPAGLPAFAGANNGQSCKGPGS